MTEMQLKKLIEKKAETKNPKEEIRRYEGRLKERLEKQSHDKTT